MRVRVIRSFVTSVVPTSQIKIGAEIDVPDALARSWIAHGLVVAVAGQALAETASVEPVRETADDRPRYARARRKR